MKQLLRLMMLMALVLMPWISWSQTLNYGCDFEDPLATTEWITTNGEATTHWVIADAVNQTDGGSYGMYISSDNGITHDYGNGTTFSCIYHELTLAEGLYDLGYDWKCVGEAQISPYYSDYYDYMRVALVPASSTIPTERPSNNFYNTLPTGWIALDGGNAMCNQSTWQHFAMELNITTAGDYKLVFCWYNDNSGSDGIPAAIDNIIFKTQTCPKPTELSVTNITANSATINWLENGNATEWRVEYGISGFQRGSGVIVPITTNSTCPLSDLSSNTLYDVYVESVCGIGDISRSEMISFRTGCGALTLPFSEDFEAYDNNAFPFCWTLRNGQAKTYNFASYAHSGLQSLEIKGDALLLTPQLSGSINETAIYFAAKRAFETSGELEIGYVSDTALWDYIAVRRILPMDDDYHMYEVDFDDVEVMGDNGYIVIKQFNTTSQWSSWYIDDIEIFQMNNCRAPKDFAITEITYNTAQLSWSCNAIGANFQVKYNDTLIEVGNAKTIILTDLQPNTTYYPEIRSICNGTDTSYWQEMGFFKTDVLCADLATIKIEPILTTSAALSWTYSTLGEQPTATLIRYKASEATDWIDETVEGNGYFLVDLTPDTEYDVELYVICNEDTSNVKAVSFKTASGVCGEMIGTDTKDSYKVPLGGGQKYSYSESLYMSDVVTGMDSILGIAYYTTSHAQTRNIKVYIGNTDKTTFSKVSEYIPYDEMNLVFDGEKAFTGAGWDTITFTDPFVTDGRNIVVCVNDQTGTSSSNKVKFRYHKGSSIYKNNNNGPIAPTDSYVKTVTEVPNIRFIGECHPATCKEPLVAFKDADANSITFAWMPGLDENSWVTDYKKMGDTVWSNLSTSTTDTFAVISNLIPGSGYEFRVGSICNNDTLFATAQGYTDCSVFEVPYFDNFDVKEINHCWRLHSAYPDGELPIIRNGELELPANSYAVLPAYAEPLTSLQLHFKLDDVGKNVPLYVGVCTEPNNPTTFEIVDTVYMNNVDPNAEHTVYMNQYEGNGEYIAFKSDIYPIYIDSLTVEYVSNCPKPTNIHVTNLGGTYLELAWDNGENMNWNASIAADGEAIETATPIVCNTPSVRFENLNINTLYNISITSVCETENSLSVTTSIKTLNTDPIVLPYQTDFTENTENEKWTINPILGNNNWYIGPAISHENANALYVSDDLGVTNHYDVTSTSATFAYIPIFIDEEGEYFISYDWRNDGKTNWDFCRVALVPITYNFATAPTNRFGYDNILPNGWIAMDNGNMQDKTIWQHTNKKQNIATPGNYYLTFVWLNDGGGGQNPPIAIDNIYMSRFACSEPENVQITDITATSATISWNPNEMVSNGWEVKLNNADPILVEDTFYTFNNLIMGTGYNVSVRAICSEEATSPTVERSFFTTCGEISQLPYRNNFDLEQEDEAPHCWNTAGEYPIVEEGTLKFYCTDYGGSSKNVISMPPLSNNIDISTVELTFKAMNNSFAGNSIHVGISTTMNDENGFTPIDTIPLSEDWNEYLVTFNQYEGDGRYIIFKTELGDDNYFDDTFIDEVTVQQASPCGRPTNAYIKSYTHNTATIAWSDTNASATYMIALSTHNDLLNPDELIEGITQTEYTIENLAGATTYTVWIASSCTDTISGWVSVGQFTTHPTCGAVENLKVIDIESTRATLTWQNSLHGATPTDYIVVITNGNDTISNDTIQTPYLFLNGLTENINYTATVTTLCDEVNSLSKTISFTPTTQAGCNSIGDGTNAMSQAPVNTWSKFSLSQMIYTADELFDMGDTIHGITFHKNNRSVFTRQIDVYLGMTDENNVSNGWIDTVSMTKMYSGSWRLPEGECSIDFETPFIRDHQKNLVVMINDHTDVSNSYSYFKYTVTEQEMTIFDNSGMANVTIASTRYTTTNNRPNITFDASCNAISCTPPSVVITDINDTDVSIAWRSGNDETSWEVSYRKATDTVWTIAETTSTTEATINGLYPGTDYKIRVGAICNENTAYRTIEFCTECGAMPLPFTEDFEELEDGQFEKICWNADGENYDSWSEQSPYIEHSRINGNSLLMYNEAWVSLPQMQGALNSLQIRMRCLAMNSTTYAIIGYMETANQFNSFHPIDTLYDHNNITGEYHIVTFDQLMDDVQGNIAIYTPAQEHYFYIDDIIVEPIRNCVTPHNITVDNITATSATLQWDGPSNNYQVTYGVKSYTPTDIDYTTITTSNNSIILDNLETAQTYDVMITAICGEGDTSYPSNAVSFTTACSPIATLPYVMNFELDYLLPTEETGVVPNCWTVAYVDNPDAFDNERPQIITDDLHQNVLNGTHSLCMIESSILALPEMEMNIDTLCLRFYNKVIDTESRIVVGVLDHVGEGCESTFQSIDTITPAAINVFEPYMVYFNNYVGTGKYIALRNINTDPTDLQSIQYFDSIVVDYIPSCTDVTHLEALATTTNTVTIDWDSQDDAVEAWQIEYDATDFTIGTGNTVITNTHPVMIIGLDPMTAYDIWVRPICGVGDTGNYGLRPLKVTTSMCDHPIEITTNPNSSTNTNSDYPFGVFYGHSYSQTIIDANYFTAASPIVGFSFTDSEGSNNRMKDCRVWMGHTSKDHFESTSDWVDADNMELVFTGDLVYEAGKVTVSLDSAFNYDGISNLIIALDRDDGDYASGHNFNIVSNTVAKTLYQHSDYQNQDPYNPTYSGSLANGHAAFEFVQCLNNTCATPTLGAITELKNESATIHWSGEGNNYEIAITKQSEANVINPIPTTGNNYVFQNLIPDMTYTYYVRQVCSESNYSDWAIGNFTTTNIIPCDTPTEIVIVESDYQSVTLDWNASEGQSQWSVHIFNNTEEYLDTVTTHPCTITSLSVGTHYNVAVKALCAIDSQSPWSDTVEFDTPQCAPVSDVQISQIGETSAQISWNAVEGQSEWEINYGYEDFGQGEGSLISVTTTNYQITNLEADTRYDVYVRAKCGNNIHSQWSDVQQFTTLAPSPTCDVPTELTAIVTEQSVTIDWTATEGQTSWEINITAESIEAINQTVSAHPATIADLTPATYTAKVRAICSETLYSDWSESITFTIEPKPTYTLTVVSNNDAWGSVTGSGEYEEGSEVEITAIPADGYHFVEWNDFNADNPRTITVNEDITYTATFAANTPEGFDGIDNTFDFTIYPNPAHGSTTISLKGIEGKVTISVLDMNGRQITNETLECNGDCEKSLNISGLSQGSYFVKVLGDNINSVRKLIMK